MFRGRWRRANATQTGENAKMSEPPMERSEASKLDDDSSTVERRKILRKLGRFAAITPPAIALLLAAASKPAGAVTS